LGGGAVMRILVLEDDRGLAAAVAGSLRRAGFAVDPVGTLAAAHEALGVHPYDTAVLDRMVPDGDAITLARRHRERGGDLPVLFLTARDQVDGFEAGDDYLVKPFAVAELVLRVRSLCRRSGGTRAAVLDVGDLRIDVARREVFRAGVALALTPKEFAVLELLATRRGVAVSRTELVEHCWDEYAGPASNVVDVVVGQLRRKLGEPALVRTVRGVGYLLDAPEFGSTPPGSGPTLPL
jgi:DNA-binding response OmpR family regulator